MKEAGDTNKTVQPIPPGDPAKRLDAIVRRHGGRPKPLERIHYGPPAPPRADCKDQRKLW